VDVKRIDLRGGVRRWGASVVLVASGLVAGAVLAGTITATANDNAPDADKKPPGASSTSAPPERRGPSNASWDESTRHQPDETPLTGDTAAKVRTAALGKYPGATVLRLETDSDGIYEAHLKTTAGERVTVEVGKDFAVTGTESGPR
jgi:hypothetical protein